MKKALLILVLFAATAAGSSLLVLSGRTPTVAAWTPTTPANTLRQWLKADALALSDNDPVATWTASAGQNATQATSGSRPLYKTNIQNSLPVVRFDGTDDWMATSAFSVAQTQPYTVLMIYKLRSIATTQRVLDGTSTGRALWRGSTGNWSFMAGASFIDTFIACNTNWHTLYLEVNAGASTFGFEGAAQTTFFTTPGTDGIAGLVVGDNQGGGVNPSFLDLMEIIIWDGLLSAGDRTSALDYARTRGATW